jgi:hypothetical protein
MGGDVTDGAFARCPALRSFDEPGVF